ncbi:MAG: hypothetical protein PSY14_00010 [bacterium]|nr:hypothetical protein [bacterium]
MAQTLEEIREKLETAFNTAVIYGDAYKGSSIGPEHMKAAAELAKAIVAVDDKMDRRNEEKGGLKMPGK